MKRDADGVMREVIRRIKLLPKQGRMLQCLARMAAAVGGTGSGKTYAWAIWLLMRIIAFPRAAHVVVGAEYDQLRFGFFETFVSLLEKIGWEDGIDFRYISSGAPVIHFPRLGKRVRLRGVSARRAERLRSTEFQSIVCEETPTWLNGENVFSVLTGRLRMSEAATLEYGDTLKPELRMSFNPPAEGSWVHELLTGETKWPSLGYPYWRMDLLDNHLMADLDAYVGNMKATWNPLRWNSEIHGYWQTGGGGVYYGYDPKVHAHPPDTLPAVDYVDPNLPIFWTHDFNVRLMCSVIGQEYRQVRRLKAGQRFLKVDQPFEGQFEGVTTGWQPNIARALDEFALPYSSAEQVLAAFLKSPWARHAREYTARTGKPGVELFGDPAGRQRSQIVSGRANNTNWKFLVYGLRAAGIMVQPYMTRAHPSIDDRVNLTNNQFLSGEGPGVTVDARKCPTLVKDWREVMWLEDGSDINKKDPLLTHAGDAWGYYIHRRRSMGWGEIPVDRDESTLLGIPDPTFV